ncbi:hypothetical protein [Pelagibius marinus]|uniref:hypothetical protein n=1 Tax=Pelagibius marinus TaxID=2762760 RepID=UPI001872B842|nr:hypothetical protein [Pelagibius marinus]
MRHLPYVVGLFMLLPFAVWLGLDLTILPGSTRNLDLPLVAALTAVCLPLLAWFFLVNLGFLANSMSGACEFERPRNPAVRLTIAALPWISLGGSLASVPLLAAEGLQPALLALPPVVGALIFFAIRFGEKARTQDRHRLRAKAAADSRPRGAGLAALGGGALRALYAVPLVGWLVKDAANGRASAKAFFAFNCFLLLAAGVAVFGYPVLIVAALSLVPLVFAGLFVLTWA